MTRQPRPASDESDDIDCAPTENRVRRDPTILELAARLNAASNRYHEATQSRRMSFSDRLARVDKLAAAADELTSAIADAVAAGDGRLT